MIIISSGEAELWIKPSSMPRLSCRGGGREGGEGGREGGRETAVKDMHTDIIANPLF